MFAQKVEDNNLASYRRDARRDLFVSIVRDYLETKGRNAQTLGTLIGSSALETFICLPEYGYERVNLRVGNLEAITTVLGSRLQAPSDELGTLWRSLGTNYAIRSVATEAPLTYDLWLTSENGKRCTDLIRSADPYVTRDYVGKEFAIAAVPAAISLINTIWDIWKPVAIETLKTVDIERRNNAIRAYFSDPKNVAALKSDLTNTENFLDKEFTLHQTKAAGDAVIFAGALFDVGSPHWKEIQATGSTPRCEAALPLLASSKTDAVGTSCVSEALAAAAMALNRALDAADAFDTAFGIQMPRDADRLSSQLDTLSDIATGKQPTDEKLKALWTATLRYVGLFQTIEEAASSANRKKIGEAYVALGKASQ
jgi:hypothetical protein